jgi:hypothetical protein
MSRELARRGHLLGHKHYEAVTTGQGATTRRNMTRRTFRALFAVGLAAIRAVLSANPDVAVFI